METCEVCHKATERYQRLSWLDKFTCLDECAQTYRAFLEIVGNGNTWADEEDIKIVCDLIRSGKIAWNQSDVRNIKRIRHEKQNNNV